MQLLGKDYFEPENMGAELYSDETVDDAEKLLPGDTGGSFLPKVFKPFVKAGKFVIRKKKPAIITMSVLIIGLAVYLNWRLFESPQQVTETDSSEQQEVVNTSNDQTDDFFSTSLINRERSRDEAIEVLQGVVDASDENSTERLEAIAGISTIAQNIEKESSIESLIKSKGISDCVAILQGDGASVIVESNGLLENEITQIQEIVYETAGILPVNLKIIER